MSVKEHECSYCGGNVPAEQIYCPGCGTEIPRTSADCTEQKSNANPIEFDLNSANAQAEPAKEWTGRDWRIFELVLVCAMAFGVSILSSGVRVFTANYTSARGGEMPWLYSLLRESLCLALLWYVLKRRSLNYSDLGLRWSLKEVGLGCLLFLLDCAIYAAWSGLITAVMTGIGMRTAHTNVNKMLFGLHVPAIALVSGFVSPFFEELIVRAFLMTELKALTNNSGTAIAGSVLVQASYHLYQGVPNAISHIPAFLIFSFYYAKTNRIGAPIVAHLLWDLFSMGGYMLWLKQHHF